jgi:hypothetical protein
VSVNKKNAKLNNLQTKGKVMKITKNKVKRHLLVAGGAVVVLTCVCAWAQSDYLMEKPHTRPDEANLRTFVELARSDLKTHKAIILAENMELTEEEGAEFWPLQREYQHELTKLNDIKLSVVEEYAANYQTMTDATARDLAKKSFDLEERKTELRRKYFKKFAKVIPATKAARFFQIDNQLNMAVDLQVAASLPLIK